MLFNSFEFLLFLPATVVLYYLLPWRLRWILLLFASYLFYASWDPKYLLLIMVTTATTWYAGGRMAALKDKEARKPWLLGSLFVNLGLLIYFKYTNFALDTFEQISAFIGLSVHAPELKVFLPVGISFYTFQSLSYSIDIYYGRTRHEKHFGLYALFVAYFPQLVMGPIERSNNLLPQLKREQFLRYEQAVQGLCKIGQGFFKKLVVADRLKLYVDEVHFLGDSGVSGPLAADGVAALISAFFFAIQMYCDFSGYSDIAIGTSRLMGVELMENFKKPFLARNISDFWVRWHISLTTWFMDYVFVPMGGYTPSLFRTSVNLLIVAMVTGIWHGASWTFIIAFGFMGVLMVSRVLYIMKVEKWLKAKNLDGKLPSVPSWVQILALFVTFSLSTTYIRANSIQSAHILLGKIFQPGNWILTTQNIVLKNGQFEFGMCLFSIFLLFLSYLVPFNLKLGRYSLAYLMGIFLVIYLFGYDGSTDFFYFQF
jgi:D-alanyl-lipoteichoic acid acyltransferase DltB (MBOAT superfamily)